jgi:uncharacterized NAD(P)/FAD-binding protein YdhS
MRRRNNPKSKLGLLHLEAREQTQADQARRELRKQLKELTQQHQATARQYDELKQEGQEAWKKMKPPMDAAVDELNKASLKRVARSSPD